jgi:tubulin monoglycylase TTLL3/8
MKSLITSQTSFKKDYFSPVLQSRSRKTAESPSPHRSLLNLNRSSSVRKCIKPKNIDFPSETPQPKKLNNYDSWKLSQGLKLQTKVFIIQGNYPDLKESLLQRGWIENKDPSSLNFDLIWVRTSKYPGGIQDWQIVNHFPNNVEISAKWNFCENIKTLSLQSLNPDSFFPKCFRISSKETPHFEDRFKVIKAISLLKIFSDSSIGLNEKIFTSLSICRRWAGALERNETFKLCHIVCYSEWKIINSTSSTECQFEFKKFFAGKSYNFSDLHQKTTEMLNRLSRVDPQFNLYGKKNIWIVKPGRKSRGRDISLFDNLESIKKYTSNPQKWVVQKYIENPLLIHGKKFDIRQWVLISSGQPMTFWVFKRSYLRFAVENYEGSSLSNLFIHLTNNSISKNSKKFDSSQIQGCMWHSEQFSEFLMESYCEDVWNQKIYPKIKEIVKNSLTAMGPLGRKKSFELLGFDFMVDSDLNVWLIEVNSSPAMDYSTVINM